MIICIAAANAISKATGGVFAYLAKNPEESRIFDAAMTSKSHRDIAALLPAYDFSQFATIADIAGGRGHLFRAILKGSPKIQGILFDQPHVVAEVSPASGEKLSVVGGNFFADPMPQADAYLLMNIIHDWADAESIKILSAIRRCMPQHACVLIIETVVPQTPGPHLSKELDIAMMALPGGTERTQEEYADLAAKCGLRLRQMMETRSPYSILEMVAANQFTRAIFNPFVAWASVPDTSPRAAVARGQAIFNSRPINITGVAGINDDVSAGGLVAGGIPSLMGTRGTCHDTPNVKNHSFPTPLNIITGDPNPSSAAVNLGGLDVSYLPIITVCKLDVTTDPPTPTSTCKTTTDLGQALIDGKFDHVGKIKGPILRGLSARAPYFHNGSAQTLLDAVRFYESRFGLVLTAQEESDLVAFLRAL